jgi:CubicO group peptidase (beta-lactamase class C family)
VSTLETLFDGVAHQAAFSGVVSIERAGIVDFAKAYGLAHRAYQVPNTVDTRFALASGTKGLTALTVVSLIADETIAPTTTARSLLGEDLPLIDDRVTVEQLLAHRSGIGDYVDEDADIDVNTYSLAVPFYDLTDTESYVPALDGFAMKFSPDEGFSYCNSGYVVLALIAERATGIPFAQLVADRVTAPAGMIDTAFDRMDALPERTATGYLSEADDAATNVYRLPAVGSGDGGIFSTVGDVSRLWRSMFAGAIVPMTWVDEMIRPRSDTAEVLAYGLGFWVSASPGRIVLVGEDAGTSFYSLHEPETDTTRTVIATTNSGAWPMAKALRTLS